MASSQAVFIASGDQPQSFIFGNAVGTLTPSTTTNQSSLPLYKRSPYSTFQAIITGTGAVSATVTFKVSNDDNTGRGYVLGGANAPGTSVTTAVSTTLLSTGNNFTSTLVGAVIVCPGVPAGTTVASVTNAGTLVMSAAGTVAATGVQAIFYNTAWCNTSIGTISLNATNLGSDGFTTIAPWRYVQAVVSAITGSGATVVITMGV